MIPLEVRMAIRIAEALLAGDLWFAVKLLGFYQFLTQQNPRIQPRGIDK